MTTFFKIRHLSLLAIVSLLLFQNCGNVSVSQAPSISKNNSSGEEPVGNPPPPVDTLEKCIRKTDFLVNLIDTQIPTNKFLYNNYFTSLLPMGEDFVILANYSYGDQIFQNQPVTGATGVVDAKFVSQSGGITPIALPDITGYSWNSQAGTAISWCYIADSKSNYIDTSFVLIYCNSSNASLGFKSLLYTITTANKVFTKIAESKNMFFGLNLNKLAEPIYIEAIYDGVKSVVNYQINKYSVGAATKIGSAFSTALIAGYSLGNPILFENESNELMLNLKKNTNNTTTFYLPLTNQFVSSNWSRNAREVMQFFDDRQLLYYSFDYGVGVINSLFSINSTNFSESKMSDDNRYIYLYQSQLKKVISKVGSDYGTTIGKAWISYDQGKNFSEIVNPPMQTSQILQTKSDKFYALGVDQYTGGHIRASLYKLNCQN